MLTTLILRPPVAPKRLTTLPLVTGVAVAEAIERITGVAALLKWPNDVWFGSDLDHPKVAGILVTSRFAATAVEHALVGIGINVLTNADDLPPGATSILAATNQRVTPSQVLEVMLERFDHGYESFLAADGRPSLEGWRARAALLGQHVTIEDTGRQFSGIFVDIDEDGALLLQACDGSLRRVVAGDLVRGPRIDNQDRASSFRRA
jgi:BirA family biotin operon repressor/biotin-[acetyl-CoA-carboxylase] ligase